MPKRARLGHRIERRSSAGPPLGPRQDRVLQINGTIEEFLERLANVIAPSLQEARLRDRDKTAQ